MFKKKLIVETGTVVSTLKKLTDEDVYIPKKLTKW